MSLDADDTCWITEIILSEHRRHSKNPVRTELWATNAANKITAALNARKV